MAESPEVEEQNGGTKTIQSSVLFADRYIVNPNAPLAHLNTPSANAFEVEDRNDLSRKLFALICSPSIPVRLKVMEILKGKVIGGVLPMVEWGTVDWTPTGKRTTMVIYERPMGGRVSDAFASGEAKVGDYDLVKQFIEPLSNALRELSKLHLTHRAVRPGNLYFMDAEYSNVVLGDCATTPPGFDQPLACETVERAMASPGGRGPGNTSDDFYALGATIVLSMPDKNPVKEMGEDELINSRIEHGSYATLCSNTRVPMSMLKAVRGLLSDDAQERWGAVELKTWADGKSLETTQKKAEIKAETPFSFADMDHFNARILARSFSRNVSKAANIIKKKGPLDLWLRQGLKADEKASATADAIAALVNMAAANKNAPLGSDDFIVSKTCIVLDPSAPIRYKGLSFMPDAYGNVLATKFMIQADVQSAIEVVLMELPNIWIVAQPHPSPEAYAFDRTFAMVRSHLQNPSPGFGIERCLYDLTSGVPCQSPSVIDMYVTDVEELMHALDAVSNRVDTKKSPLDRHVASFIAAKFDQDISPHLKALASPSEETALIGMLSLLAFLQWHLELVSLLGLSSWVGGLLGPAINTYHSRTTRREIEREIPRLVRQGSLPELFDLIDSSDKRKQDKDGYDAAIKEFAAAEKEIMEIESGEAAASEKTERAGQQAAAMTSVTIAMIVVSVLLLFKLL